MSAIFARIALMAYLIAIGAGCTTDQESRPSDPDPESFEQRSGNLVVDGQLLAAQVSVVTPEFFLGYPTWLGRAFSFTDFYPLRGDGSRAPSAMVAVVSHALWQEHFDADPAVISQVLRLDDQSRTLIGVMPPEFDLPPGTDIWIPQ